MNAKMVAERRPVVDAALQRGWELIPHNYVQTELLTDHMFDEATERAGDPQDARRFTRTTCGQARPKGWLSSSLRSTLNTADILAEEGLDLPHGSA